jgi:hypothetical protein
MLTEDRMHIKTVLVVTSLLFSNVAALAESGLACQSMLHPHARSLNAAALRAALQGEGAFAQASPRSLCRPIALLCTGAINYSVRQQWAFSQ